MTAVYRYVRFISKPCKSCKAITSIAARKTLGFPEFPTVDPPVYVPHASFYYSGGHYGAFEEEGTGTLYPIHNGSLVMHCRGCAALVAGRRVQGTFDPKIQCNAKCHAAKGFDCQCSCAGKNHGADYGASPED